MKRKKPKRPSKLAEQKKSLERVLALVDMKQSEIERRQRDNKEKFDQLCAQKDELNKAWIAIVDIKYALLAVVDGNDALEPYLP